MQSLNIVFLFLAVCVTAILAQSGPTPPRLNIPGAIPLSLKPQFRNDKLVRIRRPIAGARPAPIPNAIPIPVTPRLLEEAKPVTEEPEDETPDNYLPQFNTQPAPQPSPLAPLPLEPNFLQQESSAEEPRFQPQERPFSPQISAQRFSPAPERKVVRRPAHREPRPQFDQEAVQTIRQVPARRPVPEIEEEDFRKKPVAQILRKYREEHEDGSITWGFENDDGSFKEETIGIDCITRGRYGYVDPDGVKREYNYETGILCDPNKRDEQVEQSGFVDYEGNKAILPNGVEVDLSNMGKKKSKRPGAFIPQQGPPQSIYRN
ncbi:unnamed protein product [Hermetia illucens]|uniref:Uncharacterized protein n=1 Tax=Hermetia illucens TaxID=343691 RepID=A0A7R8V5N4_HERIL|nr:translation initiation factor IF-2 [Hermetia illucens]CAD7093346.1 unnamed protein product [Hermetia illucens]